MGLGCVLLVWFAGGAAGAVVASLVFGVATHFILRSRPGRRRWIAINAALPFLLLAYSAIAFGAYAIWCERARGVDPGLGDSWRVPLDHGYVLEMIDLPENAFIEQPTGSDQPVTAIATRGPFIYGEDDHHLPFVIDTRSGQMQRFANRKDAQPQLHAFGLDHSPIQSPSDYYYRHRWTRLDAGAAVVLALPFLLLVTLVAFRFRRAAAPARPPALH